MGDKLAGVLNPGSECLPLEELVQALAQTYGPTQQQRCERHLAACPYCSSEVALFQSFESEQPAPEERSAVTAIVSRLAKNPPSRVRPWWTNLLRPRFLTPTVMGLAAASLAVVVTSHPAREPLGMTETAATRSAQVIAVSPLGEVAERPLQLRWEPMSGADTYRVRLLEVDRTELWKASTASRSIELPPSILAKIAPRKKILWEVTATDSSAIEIASSGIRYFMLEK